MAGPEGEQRFDRELDVLRAVVEKMPTALVVCDTDGRFLYFNQAAVKILGLGSAELDPEHWGREYGLYRVDGSEEIPRDELPLSRALRGESATDYDILVKNRERPRGIYIKVDSGPLLDDAGIIVGGVATFRDVTSRRRAAELVKRLSTAIERAGDSILITDTRGRIVYVNRAFERLTGYTRREAKRAQASILESGEHDAAFFERMWRTILAGDEYRGTVLNRKKSGELFWSEQTITPVPDADGRPTHFVSVLKDITGREAQLRQERDFNAAVLGSTGALILVTDRESRLIRLNAVCERVSGYRAEELRGRRLLDADLLGDGLERWRRAFEDVLAGGRPAPIEVPWTDRRGVTLTVRWWLRGLRDDGGVVAHVVASGIDVTESRRAQRALAESERKYRRLVENLHEGLWLVDENEVTTFVNDRMAAMLGCTVTDMIGKPVYDFMDEAGATAARRWFVRRHKGIHEDHECDLIDAHGKSVHTIVQASPIMESGRVYRGALMGVLNISERKRFDRALQDAHRQLEQRVEERTSELREALAEVKRLKDRLEAENVLLREEVRRAQTDVGIVGKAPAIRSVIEQARRVAPTDSTVLLLGETGTGKGVFARAIHAWSPLAEQPLVVVDCGALPASLIESELFGHERGAFTGASRERPGRFEMADGGTLFLDEIGDMPLDLQTRLLRVLQSGEFERVGSARTRKVRTRVIAATNRDLKRMVDRREFRADLYFRLSVFPITIPPLRQRREDIPALVRHLLDLLDPRPDGRRIEVPPAALRLLQEHDWPGNVRELSNTLERALITSTGGGIAADAVRASLEDSAPQRWRDLDESGPQESLRARERAHIIRVLKRCGWRIKGAGNAAERLGLPASTLRDRMHKLSIVRPGARATRRDVRRRPPTGGA